LWGWFEIGPERAGKRGKMMLDQVQWDHRDGFVNAKKNGVTNPATSLEFMLGGLGPRVAKTVWESESLNKKGGDAHA